MKRVNSRTAKSIFALALPLLSLLPMAVNADEACGQQQKQTPVYNAFESCQEALAAKDVGDMNASMASLAVDGYCSTLENVTSTASLRNLCKDPAEAACASGGNTFNSKCQMNITKPSEIADTPDYVASHCVVIAKREKFIQDHKSECALGMSSNNCAATIRIKYSPALLQIERDAVYTPEKMKMISQMFNRVKQKYIEMIRASRIIPQSQKALLVSRIQSTTLAVPDNQGSDADCFNSSAHGASSDIYNDVYVGTAGPPHVFICIGAVSMLDSMNPYDLMHTIGHEISHSIDPCIMEELSLAQGQGNSKISDQLYPGLVSCLRGGTGPDNCTGAVLHCNSAEGISQYCRQQSDNAEDTQTCLTQAKQTPHCSMAPETDSQGDSSKYNTNPEPLDQTGESFADFMGSEVLGSIIKEDRKKNLITTSDQEDILTAIGEDYVNLHGKCLDTNTNDEHPSGKIRVDRTIMGSKRLRDALCYSGDRPPKTPFAGASCKGL
jgi:hypothetical protein